MLILTVFDRSEAGIGNITACHQSTNLASTAA